MIKIHDHKSEGSKKLQNSHRDVKHSIGNVVNHILITKHDARWVLDLERDHFVNYIIG